MAMQIERQYRGATCKGSFVLGTACGKCERCRDEAARMNVSSVAPPKVAELVPLSKRVDCSGCGKPMSVGKNVVFAYCGDCSSKSTGRKK